MYTSGKFFNFANKYFEIQADNCGFKFELSFELSFTRRCDHAGFRFYINVLGYFLDIMVYDNRHWDEENDDWCDYSKSH